MSNQKRIHGIDSLRAIAMLLGIVLHASIAYKAKPHRNWIFDEQYHSWVYSYIYFFIHSFRMPLFFLVAGFFCRLLLRKIGERAFIVHRWKRVGIPFIAGVLIIVPLSLLPYKMYYLIYKQGMDQQMAWKESIAGMLRFSGLAHLWFLYDLLLFYVVILLVMRLNKLTIVKSASKVIMQRWETASLNRSWFPALLAVLLWITMWPDPELFPITDTYVIPRRFTNLFFYGVLFFTGWLFHKRTDVFGILTTHYAWMLAGGVGCSILVFQAEFREWTAPGTWEWLALKLLAAVQVVLLVLGSIGFFLRFFTSDSKFWQYVSDASYWVYLIHLGIITGLQFLFLNSAVPGWARFPLILLITIPITFLTYHWFVRYSFIGKLLHGSRQRPQTPLNITLKNG